MPTPMSAFAVIAARHGVDPSDEEAVDRFFDESAPELPLEEREAIFAELLSADGKGDSPRRRHYAKIRADASFKDDPTIEVPARAVNPRLEPTEELAPDNADPRRLLAEEWKTVERLIETTCHRRGLREADADLFASMVKIKLFEEDCAVVRRFRGVTKFSSYLNIIIQRTFVDFYVKRFPLRQSTTSLEGVSVELANNTETDMLVVENERLRLSDHAAAVVRSFLDRLAADDRLMLQLHFESDMTLSQIAQLLGAPQRPLYRRREQLLHDLRAELTSAGITAVDVADLIGHISDASDFGLRIDESLRHNPKKNSGLA